jgi:hypothetical protein
LEAIEHGKQRYRILWQGKWYITIICKSKEKDIAETTDKRLISGSDRFRVNMAECIGDKNMSQQYFVNKILLFPIG